MTQRQSATEITFTPEKRDSLERDYRKAVMLGQKSFTWDGHEFLTDYAKYVLQYLNQSLQKGS